MFLYKNKIVVTGGTGRFGRALRKIKTKKNISFPTKEELNILDVNSIKKHLTKKKTKIPTSSSWTFKAHENSRNAN